jgi:hypothetical protein
MTRDDDADPEKNAGDGPGPIPERDPQHIDPAGDLPDAVKGGDLGLSLADDQDGEDLRAFVDAAESGELGPVDPGLEARYRSPARSSTTSTKATTPVRTHDSAVPPDGDSLWRGCPPRRGSGRARGSRSRTSHQVQC